MAAAAASPDRDLEVFMRFADKGVGANIFITDQLGLEFGLSFNILSDKGFELDGFMPFAHGSYGLKTGPNLGLLWEQTATRGFLLDQDEISWRVAAKWRPHKLYQISGATLSIFDTLAEVNLEHGTVHSFPITVGGTYTWWALPWEDTKEWWANLIDVGVFLRVEVGPDIAHYRLDRLPFLVAGAKVAAGESETVTETKLELYWNLQLGIVF